MTGILGDLHPEALHVTYNTWGAKKKKWARFLKWSSQNGIKFWEYDTPWPLRVVPHHVGGIL